jgi:hypothetical protein
VKREAKESSPEFQLLFEQGPAMCLVVLPDADFTIVAASDTYLRATLTTREVLYGRPLFEAFPDNPEDAHATGVGNVGGGFEERHWSPIHTPVLSPEGAVRYLLQQVDDVTEVVRLTQLGEENRVALKALQHAEASRRALRESEERLQRIVAGAKVFRPWGWRVALIVAEDVKEALEHTGATGLDFREVTGPDDTIRNP